MKKRIRLGTVFFLIVATAFVTAIATYYYLSLIVNDLGKNQQMYLKLDKVNQIVNSYYVNAIDPIEGYDNITDSMISGYISGLKDPYSYYLNKKDYQTSNTLGGSNISIGIKYSYDNTTEGIKVDFVKYGSPAKTAGLSKGDVIIAIDDVSVSETGYRRATQKLSGDTDSEVVLTVIRSGDGSLYTYTVKRTKFEPQTVDYRLLSSGIGYIHINEFDKTTITDFTVAYDDLISKGAEGLIFDVRFNSSGEVDFAVEILDRILPAGTILSVKEKTSSEQKIYPSDDKHISLPIVVLQNQETAGLAEVFCADLKDSQEITAIIVGVKTKGMGVGQRDIPLSDGTAIRLSAYEYIPSSGSSFNLIGIEPDYEYALEAEKSARFDDLTDEEDDQLQFAMTKLKELMGLQ